MDTAPCTLSNFLSPQPSASSLRALGLHEPALDRLDAVMQRLVDIDKLPMAMTLVARRGKVAYWRGCGRQNPGDPDVPVASDTLFRIYSMTKPITSVAIMMLVERGRLLLQQPVHLFLGPAWKKMNMRVMVPGSGLNGSEPKFEKCNKSITVKHLLTHTSGLSYGFAGGELANPVDGFYQKSAKTVKDKMETLEEHVARLATLPLCFQPGTMWNYSVATDVLGRIVEVVSGQVLSEFMREHIFTPLGMSDTFFTVPQDKMARFANCDLVLNGRQTDITQQQHKIGSYTERQKMHSGGGGLVSTMHDYLQFAQTMLDGGVAPNRYRLISRKTVDVMTSNHLPGGKDLTQLSIPGFTEVALPGVGFGLGFSVIIDTGKSHTTGASRGSFAWGGLANTAFWCNPQEQLLVIFMTQVIGLDRNLLPLRDLIGNVVSGALVDGPAQLHALHASAAAPLPAFTRAQL